MNRVALNAVVVVVGAMVHSVLLFVCSMFAFVGSFGAPQGGDAIRPADQHPTIVAILSFFFDSAIWLLAFPCSALRISLTPFSVAWVTTSLLWGVLYLVIARKLLRPRVKIVSAQNA